MLGTFPKRQRLIFDMDGMYNPVVKLDGYDFNHRNEAERDGGSGITMRWRTV